MVPPPKKAALAKKAKTPEKLPYKKSEEKVIATSKAEVKQFFDKLKERKERLNREKPHFYVKPEELRKKVADQQKKQREAQKKLALLDYERSLVKSSQPRKRVGKEVPQLGEVSKSVPPLIVPNQYG